MKGDQPIRARNHPPAARPEATPPPAELIDGLVPAVAVVGLPAAAADAARSLGVQPAAFRAMPDGTLQAEFDLPRPSRWRLWPGRGAAIWTGADARNPEPPVRWGWARPAWGMRDALGVLARTGLWPQDGRILGPSGWGASLPAVAVVPLLDEHAEGFGGTFSAADGRVVRGVLFTDGRTWAEDPVHAERWLLTVMDGLDDRSAVGVERT